MKKASPFLKILPWLFLIFFLSWVAIRPLFRGGFFGTHDGDWMVIRLTDFHRSLVSGMFPVRWAERLNHGYGYPVFNFLYPLFLYLGELLYLFTGNFLSAIKGIYILSFVLSGFFMFLWAGKKWGTWPGLAAAMVYIYTPYRFLDVYVRGSVGEALAFVFPPLIFWAVDTLGRKKSLPALAIGSLAFAGLITAHNVVAMLFTLVLGGYVVFCLFVSRKKQAFFRRLAMVILGLGLACFFWLPALYDQRFILFGSVQVSDFFRHFPTLRQLVVLQWGHGPSLPGSGQDEASFQIGVINIAIILAFLAVGLWRFFQSRDKRGFLKGHASPFYFLLVFGVSIFFMTENSAWFWRLFRVDRFIQFPWRLLSLTTFASAFLTGAVIAFCKRRLFKVLAIMVIAAVIGANFPYAEPLYPTNHPSEYYTTNEATTTVANEYLPKWVKKPPTVRAEERVKITAGNARVTNLEYNSRRYRFTLIADNDVEGLIAVHYFPGWQLEINGQKAEIDFSNEMGLIGFAAGPGENRVVAVFRETPLRLLADIVSLASFVFLGSLGLRLCQKKKKK